MVCPAGPAATMQRELCRGHVRVHRRDGLHVEESLLRCARDGEGAQDEGNNSGSRLDDVASGPTALGASNSERTRAYTTILL